MQGAQPQWRRTLAYADEQINRLALATTAGLWEWQSPHQRTAHALHPALIAPPDAPAVPTAEATAREAWIQRVVRIAHVAATIRTVQGVHPLSTTGADPLEMALSSTALALEDIAPAAAELERLWGVRLDQSVSAWERAHVSRALRDHVHALEQVLGRLASVLYFFAHDDT
ncbi:hypothetical protein [Streptomyces zagrosensis]|uniref:Uncharacterized protein n=1 Tax=Streptomyces zagrosensis TaxID=1042984 RepID=A0A7W9QHT4_9ACTN|nr:hypothetical protein [Streptomyces zagrosensis]MBB5940299.1 hypothetical protein [Streptomyces zagrosensis]